MTNAVGLVMVPPWLVSGLPVDDDLVNHASANPPAMLEGFSMRSTSIALSRRLIGKALRTGYDGGNKVQEVRIVPKSETAKAVDKAKKLQICARFKEACSIAGVRNHTICKVTGKPASTVTGWMNGNRRPPTEDLKRLQPLLGHSPSYFFTGVDVGLNVSAVERSDCSGAQDIVERFKASLSTELGTDVRGLRYEIWKPLVPDTALGKILPICAEALPELEGLMRGSEMMRAMEMVHVIMDLAGRGRYLQRPVNGADKILIDAAKQGGNFCCFLGLEAEIEQKAGRYLLPLYSELDHNPHNKALRAATYCLHGDVLKIAAAVDPTKYPMSQSLLQRSRDASQGLPRWSTEYPNTRSLAIVAGHIDLPAAEFGKIADRVERDIESGHLVPFKSAHSRDGLVEMHAARYANKKDRHSELEALRHWDLYTKEWKHAEETNGSHDEFRLRGEMLKTKLADANIFGHLGCDKGHAHTVLEESNTKVLRIANAGESPRVAAQAERGVQKWRR